MEYDATDRHLLHVALAPATDSSALLAKTNAISELDRRGVPVPLDRIRAELTMAIQLGEQYHTSRSRAAARMALRLLAILDGEPDDVWPSETPDAIVTDGYWHPDPEWADLDAGDTQGDRDAWRERLEGPPPWKREPETP